MLYNGATGDDAMAIDPPLDADRRRWRLPIIWLLVLALPTLTFVAVASVLTLGLIDARAYTRTLVRDRADALLDTAVDALASRLDPVSSQLATVAQEFASGAIDAGDDEAVYRYLSGVLTAVPQASGIGLARPDRRSSLFYRVEGRVVRDRQRTSERARQWEEQARQWTTGRWIEPLWTTRVGRPAIMLLQPLQGPQGYIGILLVPVPIDGLSRQLASLSATSDQTAFVLFGRDQVLLHPLLQDRSDKITPEHPLPAVAGFDDRVLARIWDPAAMPLSPDVVPPHAEGRSVTVDGTRYLFIYRPLTRYGEAPWVVGIYARAGILNAVEMHRITRLAMGGGAILVVSVLLSLGVGRLLGRPIRRFALASRAIQTGDFTPPQVHGSVVREFDQAARAFNDMVDGLRERERIRDLFGKYVPREVADTVLADPHGVDLRGEKREITVLFSDIEGFTALAEDLPPDHVLTLLNRYFEGVAGVLVEHGGIIVDFIGDAVFAIFGAPVGYPDHARRALAAAREVARFAETFAHEQRRTGLALGRTRIGLHTGVAIVGNIGSRDRLKYGAAGDVVNTASRIEGANKLFGSAILASAATVEHAADPDCRPLGRLVLKGRHAPIELHEVLESGAGAADWHAAYLAAFDLAARRAPEAAASFRRLARARPDDRAVRWQLDRLEHGLADDLVELTEK
jgi:class 3 adenylate cyclase